VSGRLISRLLKDPEPTGSTRLVLLVIASHARDDGHGAELAVATIAREAGMTTERAARKCVSKLTKAGYLTDTRRPRRVNLWTVHPGGLNPVRTDPHQPGTDGPPSAVVNPARSDPHNPVRTDPHPRSDRTPTPRSDRTPTRRTGVKEPASEPGDSLGSLIAWRVPSAGAPATNGSNPPDDESSATGPVPDPTEATAIKRLERLWGKPPSEKQLVMIREVVDRADADRRAPGWAWVIDLITKWASSSELRASYRDPVTYMLALDKRWKQVAHAG